MNVKRYEESYFKNIDLFTENNTEETYLKNLIKFNEKYIKKGLIFETIDFKIKLTLFKNTTLYLPFLELKENQLSFLKNRLEQIKINEKTGTAIKTKFDFFQEKLQEAGFYNLEKVKGLEPKSQNKLIELVLDNASYGIAMFDFLGFCEFLDLENGVKKKTNTFLSRLYNQNAKDDTKARHLRNSLKTKKPRYTSYLHKEQVKKDYQELK